jgi:outer membrane protein assembly factor BamB
MASNRLTTCLLLGLLFTVGCSDDRTPAVGGKVSTDDINVGGPLAGDAADWTAWRGPNRNGVAVGDNVPTDFSPTKNIIWKAELPGRGHSSPTLVGERIYLATADEKQQVQSVLALERDTGKQIWKTDLHTGDFPPSGKMHGKSSHASCTVACDGERLFVAFLNHDAIHVTALDLDGKQVWQETVGKFDPKFGYAPSPTLYEDAVIIAADHQGGGHITSLDRKSGKQLWQIDRPAVATYSSPIVLDVAGREQLLISGAEKVVSYDPKTGKEIWSAAGTAEATVGTVIAAGDVVFASGGYPQAETVCIKADGSGDVVWRDGKKTYVPSMLVHAGALYVVDDKGIARCYDAGTGKLNWQQRLGGGYSASPILAGEYIYAASEQGQVVVFKANSKAFEKVTDVRMGSEVYATPVACGDRLYLRVADNSSGKRMETLYCVGK